MNYGPLSKTMIGTSKNDKLSVYTEITLSPLFIVILNSSRPTDKILLWCDLPA
jgi:hypothetical protein